jgi:hypothetical protein
MFDIALLIPILALSIPIVAIWTRHRQKLAEMELQAASLAGNESDGKNARSIRELEARVRVLERIVTDGGYDLATRIEALREPDTAVKLPEKEMF